MLCGSNEMVRTMFFFGEMFKYLMNFDVGHAIFVFVLLMRIVLIILLVMLQVVKCSTDASTWFGL